LALFHKNPARRIPSERCTTLLNARSIPPTQPANIPRYNLCNDLVLFG
jgi:hypothetical protein